MDILAGKKDRLKELCTSIKPVYWAAVVLTVFSALLRFYKIDQYGLTISDPQQYYYEAMLWVNGVVGPVSTLRPITSIVYATAIKLFGETDYSIKLVNCFLGTAIVPMIFYYVRLISNKSHIAFGAAVIIAISPMMVTYSRLEFPVILACFFVLSSLIALAQHQISYDKSRYRYAWFYLALSAVLLGVAVQIREDTGFLGAGIFLYLALSRWQSLPPKASFFRILGPAFLFSVVFFCFLAISIYIMGVDRVVAAVMRTLNTMGVQKSSSLYLLKAFSLTSYPFQFDRRVTYNLEFGVFKNAWFAYALLPCLGYSFYKFKGALASRGKNEASLLIFLPPILVANYFLFYILFGFQDYVGYVYISFAPLIAFSVVYWLSEIIASAGKRDVASSPIVWGVVLSLVFAMHPWKVVDVVGYPTNVYALHEVIGGEVGDDSQVLMAPTVSDLKYNFFYWNCPFYFKKQHIHTLEELWPEWDLAQFVKEEKIRFIVLGYWREYDLDQYIEYELKYLDPFSISKEDYSYQKEYDILLDFARKNGAIVYEGPMTSPVGNRIHQHTQEAEVGFTIIDLEGTKLR